MEPYKKYILTSDDATSLHLNQMPWNDVENQHEFTFSEKEKAIDLVDMSDKLMVVMLTRLASSKQITLTDVNLDYINNNRDIPVIQQQAINEAAKSNDKYALYELAKMYLLYYQLGIAEIAFNFKDNEYCFNNMMFLTTKANTLPDEVRSIFEDTHDIQFGLHVNM